MQQFDLFGQTKTRQRSIPVHRLYLKPHRSAKNELVLPSQRLLPRTTRYFGSNIGALNDFIFKKATSPGAGNTFTKGHNNGKAKIF